VALLVDVDVNHVWAAANRAILNVTLVSARRNVERYDDLLAAGVADVAAFLHAPIVQKVGNVRLSLDSAASRMECCDRHRVALTCRKTRGVSTDENLPIGRMSGKVGVGQGVETLQVFDVRVWQAMFLGAVDDEVAVPGVGKK